MFRALVLLALILRLIVFFGWHGGELTGSGLLAPLGDQEEYVGLADSMLHGRGYVLPYDSSVPAGQPYLFRPPLYPLFLAGLRGLTGGHAGLIRLVQLLLTVLFVPLAWRLARLLGASAPLAGFLAATNPFLFYFAMTLQSDWLFQLTLAAALVAWTAWLKGEARPTSVGLWLAFASLTRGEGWYMAWALVAVTLVARRGLRPTGALLLAFLLPIAPWAARNYWHNHEFIPIQRGILGLNLVLANGPPWTRTAWPGLQEWQQRVLAQHTSLPEGERDRYLLAEARTYFWAHRGLYLKSCLEKLGRVVGGPNQGDDGTGQATPHQGRGIVVLAHLGFTVFVPLAALGALVLLRQDPWLAAGYGGVWLVNLAAFVLTNPSLRIRSQLQFLYLALAALGATWLVTSWRSRSAAGGASPPPPP